MIINVERFVAVYLFSSILELCLESQIHLLTFFFMCEAVDGGIVTLNSEY